MAGVLRVYDGERSAQCSDDTVEFGRPEILELDGHEILLFSRKTDVRQDYVVPGVVQSKTDTEYHITPIESNSSLYSRVKETLSSVGIEKVDFWSCSVN